MSTGASAPGLAVIGDVHVAMDTLDRVLAEVLRREADAVLLVGDLACAGWQLRRTPSRKARYREERAAVLDRVRATGLPLRWVPGNHDLPSPRLSPDLAGECADGRVEDFLGLRLGGLGGAGPARFGFAYEWTEKQAAEQLEDLGPVDVLLAHAPPRGTALDLTASGQHVGSEAVGSWVREHARVMVCGHIHEAPGVIQLGGCLCLNAGGLGAPHGAARLGWIDGLDRVGWADLEVPGEPEWTWLSRSG